MNDVSILIYYHCGSNTGYAIAPLEDTFFKMAKKFTGDIDRIHIGYPNFNHGRPTYIPEDFENLIHLDSRSPNDNERIFNYIKSNNIKVVFGFDQGVTSPVYKAMRRAGVKLFISYWGAPMSSINTGLKLFLKRSEVFLRRNKPDHYIFESNAMADTAVYGRGIRKKQVSVIRLGVDTDKYKPDSKLLQYAHQQFDIPFQRKIIFYSGHMEKRKGVDVIINSANELICNRCLENIHFLIVGNKNNEEKVFEKLYKHKNTANHITFGGYRADIHKILPSCFAGTIASTGWDSFTMSSVEMAASGVPLLVSNLQGLKETVDHGKTGFVFSPGNSIELSGLIESLLSDEKKHSSLSKASRERALNRYSKERQVDELTELLNRLYKSHVCGQIQLASALPEASRMASQEAQ